MLVLTRKLNEQLTIKTPSGEVIIIEVKNLRKGSVKIGVQARRDVTIHRTETLEQGDK